jgi:hypothetical protein
MCGGQGGHQNRRAGLSKCDKSGVTQMCKICRHCREAVGGSRIPMNTKRFTQIFAGQLNWVDMGAKILQQPDCLCDGGGHFRIDGSIWRLGPQSDLRAFEDALPQHERRQLADTLVPVLDIPPDLAEALVRGRLDVAFLRAEPTFDLCYEVVDHEPLIVLMPSDHRLTGRKAIHPREFVGEIFIGGSNKAAVLRAVTEDYLRRSGLDIKLDHGVDNMAMAMSLVASTRGLALMPAYAKNLLPWSVVSRPLEGEAPTIDLAVGYSKANTSPILKLFLSKIDELTTRISSKARDLRT